LAWFLLRYWHDLAIPFRDTAMSLSKHLHRALFALPLLGVALLATQTPPPKLGDVVENVVAASLACEPANQDAGPLGLTRVPGDLGLLTRRINCNA